MRTRSTPRLRTHWIVTHPDGAEGRTELRLVWAFGF